MSALAHGDNTSAVEVTNISVHGLWVLADGKEHLLSYEDFPWFKHQPVRVILDVEMPSPGHFYWPDIAVDLTEEMIQELDHFPLKAKSDLIFRFVADISAAPEILPPLPRAGRGHG